MKILTLLAAVMVISATSINIGAASSTDPSSAQVTIDNYAFKAPSITIAPGTVVSWKNLDDDPHTVTATDGSFDSNGLAQGDTFSHKFVKAGTYQYYCKVHPMMRGTVIVKEQGT